MLDAVATHVESNSEDVAQRKLFLDSLPAMAKVSNEAVDRVTILLGALKETAKLSRALRTPIKRIQNGLQGFLDGKDLIDEWGRRAHEMQKSREGAETQGNIDS
jgi:hypothetical protein